MGSLCVHTSTRSFFNSRCRRLLLKSPNFHQIKMVTWRQRIRRSRKTGRCCAPATVPSLSFRASVWPCKLRPRVLRSSVPGIGLCVCKRESVMKNINFHFFVYEAPPLPTLTLSNTHTHTHTHTL